MRNIALEKQKTVKVPKDRLNWKEASDYWTKDSPMAEEISLIKLQKK